MTWRSIIARAHQGQANCHVIETRLETSFVDFRRHPMNCRATSARPYPPPPRVWPPPAPGSCSHPPSPRIRRRRSRPPGSNYPGRRPTDPTPRVTQTPQATRKPSPIRPRPRHCSWGSFPWGSSCRPPWDSVSIVVCVYDTICARIISTISFIHGVMAVLATDRARQILVLLDKS